MSNLFVTESGTAVPNTETLLIEPFKTIWERDTNSDKAQALKEFTYMELMTSKKKSNTFSGYDEDKRHLALSENIFNTQDYKPDPLVERGMSYLVEFQTNASPTYSFYTAALLGAEKVKDFLENFDINERDDKGKPIFKPNEIIIMLKNMSGTLESMHAMKEKVEQELFETTRTRGNKQINYFEQ